MRHLMLIGLVIVALSAVACERRVQQPTVAKTLNQGVGESDLVRYEDKELGVICYRVRNYEGLSCISKTILSVQ